MHAQFWSLTSQWYLDSIFSSASLSLVLFLDFVLQTGSRCPFTRQFCPSYSSSLPFLLAHLSSFKLMLKRSPETSYTFFRLSYMLTLYIVLDNYGPSSRSSLPYNSLALAPLMWWTRLRKSKIRRFTKTRAAKIGAMGVTPPKSFIEAGEFWMAWHFVQRKSLISRTKLTQK